MRSSNLIQEGHGHSNLRILANATESDLLQSGNKAYIELRNEKTKLEYALDAQRYSLLVCFSAYIHSLQRFGSTIACISKSALVAQAFEHKKTSR